MAIERDGQSLSSAAVPTSLPEGACRALVDASPAPMWIYDAQVPCVIAVNERALRCFGLSRQQFSAMAATLSVPGAEESGRNLRHHRRSDGSVVTLRLQTSRVEVAGRAATLAVAVDLTSESEALAEKDRRCRDLAASESMLRDSERRFRQLFEIASDWYWEADSQARMTFVSSNFEAIYGFKMEDRIGKRFVDFPSVKIDAESGQKALAAIRARQPYRNLVFSMDLPDGRTVWARTSAVPMFDGDRLTGYCGISNDITAEVETDRALRESERQFRQVLEAAADFYWEQDTQYRMSYLSPSWETVTGVPAAESLGKRLGDSPGVSIPPEMGRMAVRAYQKNLPFRDLVYSRKTPDGQTRWFKASGAPVFDRDGTFQGYRGVGADITQHVKAEGAMRAAQQRLHEAVAHVTPPIVVYDSEDRVVAFNQAFADLHRVRDVLPPIYLNFSFRELAEWQLRFGFYAEEPDGPVVDLDMLLERYQSEAEHTYHLSDGRWMLAAYRRLPGGGRVGLWSDVTAIKRADADRRALERQVLHSQRLEALGTLAGGVAHEINNALVPVIALTKMVAAKLPEESRERRNLVTALAGAERSRDLVKQILAFSRKEAEERGRQGVDVAAVLLEALRLMRATLPASIRVEDEIAAVPPVTGDPSQLHQVIVNLMTNAAQAIGPAQGRIMVALKPDPGGAALRLSVSDTGCGMDEAMLSRIFEPFFTTKQVGEGTGLGLSVAHGIVKDHGGRIEVQSQPGRGARFDVVLPLQPGAAKGNDATPPPV
jgi:PAS domain S-box-containing protein